MGTHITNVREISNIAYGFIASKALFAALHIDLFGLLSQRGKSLAELADETKIPESRLAPLVISLSSLGLLEKQQELYVNAPASQRYLVRNAPAYFGDYYRFQIDRQIYPALMHLNAGMDGNANDLAFASLAGLTSDPAEADAFTRAQHSGSMGAALILAKKIDLSGNQAMLDVGGGSGAFSIAFCQAYPNLRATVLDYPNVIDVATRFVSQANLADRISFIRSDAQEQSWPGEQDVVLMSYLLSAVSEQSIPVLLRKAWSSLRSGGRMLIHDFMLDDAEDGPSLAALWFLQYVSGRLDGVSFSAAKLSTYTKDAGFIEFSDQVVIHDITKLVVCTRP
jgi:2-hydroxy-4-(methylsulfanyl)butanoate S-methyltransferase